MTDEDRQTWRAFCRENTMLDSPFFAQTYTDAAAKTRPGARVAIFYTDGGIAAFFPYHMPTMLHAMVGYGGRIGGHLTDAFGLIAAPEFRANPATLLRHCGLHYLQYAYLPREQLSYGLSGGRLDPGLAIDLTIGPERYLQQRATANSKFFKQLARDEKRLAARHGPLKFCFQQENGARHLDHLIEKKSEQYRRTNVYPALDATWTNRLLHDLTESHDTQCTAVLSTLHAGETWVASHIGLQSERVLHYWLPVYNVGLKSCSPGHLLLDRIINEARSRGLQRVDLGTGTQRAKRVFATMSKSYYSGSWHRPGMRGIIGRAANYLGLDAV